ELNESKDIIEVERLRKKAVNAKFTHDVSEFKFIIAGYEICWDASAGFFDFFHQGRTIKMRHVDVRQNEVWLVILKPGHEISRIREKTQFDESASDLFFKQEPVDVFHLQFVVDNGYQ